MAAIKRSLNRHYEGLWEICLCNVAYFLKTHIKEIKEAGCFKVSCSEWKYLLWWPLTFKRNSEWTIKWRS